MNCYMREGAIFLVDLYPELILVSAGRASCTFIVRDRITLSFTKRQISYARLLSNLRYSRTHREHDY